MNRPSANWHTLIDPPNGITPPAEFTTAEKLADLAGLIGIIAGFGCLAWFAVRTLIHIVGG